MMYATDPSDLNDLRPSDPPMALWHEMVVSSIHHEQTPTVSWEDHCMVERIVLDLIDRSESTSTSFSIADAAMRAAWDGRPRRAC